ncbi:NUDIX domain-containing protein [Nesterenkonia marinintestina]|uniref:NUDIX domain-containing protein n=1 Tax=Nesterenkonia marinintestina TaxID=2979865 RepID=UPI0021C14F37|nr:NUDIX hydrolase [Nesterenkonia sp. GX14115]
MGILDSRAPRSVVSSQTVRTTPIFDVVEDRVRLSPEADPVTRAYLRHPGAVAVLAADDDLRVLLIRQYRHPVGEELWEIPAGLLDVEGEPPEETARRELFEEADLRAERWTPLVEHLPSPGSTDEAVRLFLAEGLHEVPEDQRHRREHEEAEIVTRWVPLSDLVEAVMSGSVRNANTVVGALALQAVHMRDRARAGAG